MTGKFDDFRRLANSVVRSLLKGRRFPHKQRVATGTVLGFVHSASHVRLRDLNR